MAKLSFIEKLGYSDEIIIKENKEDIKGDLDRASSDIKLQLTKDQGEIKEHLANKIGSNKLNPNLCISIIIFDFRRLSR